MSGNPLLVAFFSPSISQSLTPILLTPYGWFKGIYMVIIPYMFHQNY